jgi:hypothetical protein
LQLEEYKEHDYKDGELFGFHHQTTYRFVFTAGGNDMAFVKRVAQWLDEVGFTHTKYYQCKLNRVATYDFDTDTWNSPGQVGDELHQLWVTFVNEADAVAFKLVFGGAQ